MPAPRTAVAGLSSGIFIFLAMFTLAPLAQYIPRAALAGALDGYWLWHD